MPYDRLPRNKISVALICRWGVFMALASAALLRVAVPCSASDVVSGTRVFTEESILPDHKEFQGLALTDLNGDGDLDLAASGFTNWNADVDVVLLRNDAGVFSEVLHNIPGYGNGPAFAWADYDKDGDSDLFMTGQDENGDAQATLFRQVGTNLFADAGGPFSPMDGAGAAWGDYDNDGDLDLVGGGYGDASASYDPISVLYNNASGVFSVVSAGLIPCVGSFAWADYDGDGDLDLAAAGQYGSDMMEARLTVYRNDGGGVLTNIGDVASVGFTENPTLDWGDFDNDGDPDLIVGGSGSTDGTWDTYTEVTYIYRNDGSNVFTELDKGLPEGWGWHVQFVDFDRNDTLDVFAGGRLFSNDGAGNLTDTGADFNCTGGSPTEWGDLNGDSYPELVLGDYTHGLKIFWSASAAPISNVVLTVSSEFGSPVPAVGAHTNASGTVVACSAANQTVGLTNYACTGWSGTGAVPAAGTNSSVEVTVDEDSSITWNWQTNYWLEVTVSGNGSISHADGFYAKDSTQDLVATPAAGWTFTGWSGDASGTNDAAVVMAGPKAVTATFIHEVEAGTRVFTEAVLFTGSESFQGLALPDLDGDGDLDVAACVNPQGGGDTVVSLYANTACVLTPTAHDLPAYQNNPAFAWADVDKDGDSDLFMAGLDSNWDLQATLFRQTGSNLFAGAGGLFTPMDGADAVWGDYDNDGDLDLVSGGYGGEAVDWDPVTVLYNNAGGTFSVIDAGLIACAGDFAWADYDGDGDLDLASAGRYESQKGRLSLYRNDGGGGFTSLGDVATIRFSEMTTLDWGDFDGDGDPDLIVAGGGSNDVTGAAFSFVTYIYRNDGGDVFTELDKGLPPGMGWVTGFVDFDQNGTLDVFAGGGLFSNDGAGNFTDTGASFGYRAASPTEWGDLDGDGYPELVVGDYANGLKIFWNSGVTPVPRVTAAATPNSGYAPLTVTLTPNVSGFTNALAGYAWTYGDGQVGTATQAHAHVYGSPGTFTATLVVTDDQGTSATGSAQVVVSDPGTAPPVEFTSETTIAAADRSHDNRNLLVNGCTLTIEGDHTFADVTCVSNATVVFTGTNLSVMSLRVDDGDTFDQAGGSTVTVVNTLSVLSNGTYIVRGANKEMVSNAWVGVGGTIRAGACLVEAGGHVHADIQGYYGQGSPAGPGAAKTSGSGGTHGGYGGRTEAYHAWGTLYGRALCPVTLGSSNYEGYGSGGGAIHLVVSDTLTLNGVISSDGRTRTTYGRGGGSGGSLWIEVDTLTGGGSFRAKGGKGYTSGGGGGRIAVHHRSGDASTIMAQSSVAGGSGSGLSHREGQAGGMIFVRDGVATPYGWVRMGVDESAARFTSMRIADGDNFVASEGSTVGVGDDLVIESGALFYVGGGGSLDVGGNLTIQSNATIIAVGANRSAQVSNEWVGAGTTISASNLTIAAGGRIHADGYGYTGVWGGVGNGPGGGPKQTYGGTYGGRGSKDTGGLSWKGVYGDPLRPVDLGSAGGSYFYSDQRGGHGGGAIHINVSSTFSLDGIVSANGVRGSIGAAGAGGSVWVETAVLTGGGYIEARGGADSSYGCGGGGRVAVHYQDVSGFTGKSNCSAAGGEIGHHGEPGTVVFFQTTPGDTRLEFGGGATFVSQSFDLSSLTFPAGAALAFEDCSLNLASPLMVGSNSSLTVEGGSFNVSGPLALDGNASLEMTGSGTWSVGGLSMSDGSGFTLGGGSLLTIEGTMHVPSNATVTVQGANRSAMVSNEWVGVGGTIRAGNVIVDAGGNITANAQGYTGVMNANGNGPGGGFREYSGSAGGGYGGRGGHNPAWSGGHVYGDPQHPADLGSAGGGTQSNTTRGGHGGGAIALFVTNALVVDGTIQANGENIWGLYPSGGAGGSLWITANTLSGSGSITALGGNTQGGYGGGGGRIAVYYDDASGFSNWAGITAKRGCVHGGDRDAYSYSQDGTVLLLDMSGVHPGLRVDERMAIPVGMTQTFASVTIAPGARLELGEDSRISVDGRAELSTNSTMVVGGGTLLDISGDLHVPTNATVWVQCKNRSGQVEGEWAGEGATIWADNVTVADGGRITGYGQGYAANNGPGKGIGVGGGGHGGTGGRGVNYGAGGGVYGNEAMPVEPGSGAGSGGAGGGAIRLAVDGTLTLDGQITAGGQNGPFHDAGGGSGGSVWLYAHTITGGGIVAAEGGVHDYYGGDGGGGRVAVYFEENANTNVAAWSVASPGRYDASDGTLVVTNGDLLVWTDAADERLVGTEGLSWAGAGFAPRRTHVDVTASHDGIPYPLIRGAETTDSVPWDSTTMPNGMYSVRASFIADDGTLHGEAHRQVLINNDANWHAGTITSDTIWAAGEIHIVDADVMVASNVTLTVEAGAVVKFAPGTRLVAMDWGVVDAQGTESDPVVLTSLSDDTGGDWNLDGSSSIPLPGDWLGLVTEGSGQLLLNDFTHQRYVRTSHSGTIVADQRWLGGYVHHVTDDVVVSNGVALTIEPGAVVKFDTLKRMTVRGTLLAIGTKAEPITFTSLLDDSVGGDLNSDGNGTAPNAGDWRGLFADAGTIRLGYAEVRYGAGTGGDWTTEGCLVRANPGATVTISNSVLRDALYEGVIAWGGGNVRIVNTIVRDCDRGVTADSGCTMDVLNSTFFRNRVGIHGHGGTLTVRNAIVANSLEIGVYRPGGMTLAHCNVWSDQGTDYDSSDPTGSNGMISEDPKFKNADQGDLRLNFLSPCIDSADGTVAPASDKMGAPRYTDPRTANTGVPMAGGVYVDMGAYEFVEDADSDVDLVVRDVSGPATVVAGEEVVLRWTIVNIGSGQAVGPWRDRVSLADSSGSSDSLLPAAVEVVGNSVVLAAGQRLTVERSVRVPGGRVGASYRWRVDANIRADVFEGRNRANNTGVSPSTVTLSLPVVATDSSTSGQFNQVGDSYWFRIDPADHGGADLTLSLDLTAANGSIEMFAAEGYVPTPDHFDMRQTEWNAPDVSLVIPGSATRAYYVLVRARALPDGPSAFDLTLATQTFMLSKIEPQRAGNAGQVTLKIHGGQLSDALVYELLGPSNTVRQADSVWVFNSTLVYGTFNLTGVAEGLYDLRVTGESQAQLDDVLEVSAAGESKLVFMLQTPAMYREGRSFNGTLRYHNDGSGDIDAPFINVQVVDGVGMIRNTNSVGAAQSGETWDSIMLFALNQSGGAPETLPPDGKGEIPFTIMPYHREGQEYVDVELNAIHLDAIVGWDELKDEMQPDDMSDEAWEVVYRNFRSRVGTTYGDFRQALAKRGAMMTVSDFNTSLGEWLGELMAEAAADADATVRHEVGALGYGLPDPTLCRLVKQSEDEIVFYEGASARSFEEKVKDVYEPADRDGSVLYVTPTGYELEGFDGLKVAFDEQGDVITKTDSCGNQLRALYGGGRLTGWSNNTGVVISYDYNAEGRIRTITDQAGRAIRFDYDASGEHMVKTWREGEYTNTITHVIGRGDASDHAVASVTDALGRSLHYAYDGMGRVASITRGDGSLVVGYRHDGDALVASNALGNAYQMAFNGGGSLLESTDPLGRTCRYTYDANANVATVTDPMGRRTDLVHDEYSRVMERTDARGHRESCAYAGSWLAGYTDPRGYQARFRHDTNGSLVEIAYPGGSTWSAGYDDDGLMMAETNTAGEVVTYTYDSARGRLISQEYGSGRLIEYAYDAMDNVTNIVDRRGGSNYVMRFTYTAADQVESVTDHFGRTTRYAYDAVGRRSEMVYPDGSVLAYTYDAWGQLAATSLDSQTNVTYTYDAAGRMVRREYANGAAADYIYNAADELVYLTNSAPDGSVVSSYHYYYDPCGRCIRVDSDSGMTIYEYDALGQLITANLPGGETRQYEYDACGNRIALVIDGQRQNCVADHLNQLVRQGNRTFTYDAAGRLVGAFEGTDQWTYAYDEQGNLTESAGPDGVRSYEYDALGQLMAVVADGRRTEYAVDPVGDGTIVAEYDGSGVMTSRYVFAHGLVARQAMSGGTAYAMADGMLNVSELLSDAGTVLNRYRYLPFGGTRTAVEAVPCPFRYRGHFGNFRMDDELHYVRERTYASSIGRFMTRDPGMLPVENLYAYCYNDPVNDVDVTGFKAKQESMATKAWNLFDTTKNRVGRYFDALDIGGRAQNYMKRSYSLYKRLGQVSPYFRLERRYFAKRLHWIGKVMKRPFNKLASKIGSKLGPAFNVIDVLALSKQTKDLASDWWNGRKSVTALDVIGSGSETVLRSLTLTVPFIGDVVNGGKGLAGWGARFLGRLTSGVADPGEKGYFAELLGEKAAGRMEEALRRADAKRVKKGKSDDPNDIVGPGYGDLKWIDGQWVLDYKIRFENKTNATLAAQTVLVTNQLSSRLDWSTFELQQFGFGTNVYDVPGGLDSYHTVVDQRAAFGLDIGLSAELDQDTGMVTWYFESLDPNTGLLTEDPIAGFLPPNTNPPCGEGFVSYRIQCTTNLVENDQFYTQAGIVFDVNKPIETPTWTNTVDTGTPVGQVVALPSESDRTFMLSLSGVDAGAGVAYQDLYMSRDGAPYELWQAGMTGSVLQVTAEPGVWYGFYSVAHDGVGHSEPVPRAGSAEAWTQTRFYMTGMEMPMAGRVVLNWESATGKTYRVAWSSNLTEGFTAGPSNLWATPPMNTFTGDVGNAGGMYYRIEVE